MPSAWERFAQLTAEALGARLGGGGFGGDGAAICLGALGRKRDELARLLYI